MAAGAVPQGEEDEEGQGQEVLPLDTKQRPARQDLNHYQVLEGQDKQKCKQDNNYIAVDLGAESVFT